MKAIKYLIYVFLLTFQTISGQNFWQQTNGPYGVPTVHDFLRYNDSTIFIATSEGLIKSTDNGKNWERITGQYLNSNILCIAKDYLGVLYIGTKGIYPSGLRVFLKSTDQGSTWNYVNTNHDAEIKFIFISYKDTILIGSWNMGVIRTFDGGVTWNRANNGNIYNGIHEITQLDDGSILAGSDGGGVFKTTNWGDLWIASNSGIPPNPNGYIYAESFFETSPGNIFTGTGMGIYFSSDYGNNWIFKSTGLTNYKTAQCINKDVNGLLYAGIDMSNGVYYSTNGGDYWYHLGLGSTIYTLGWDSESRLYAGGSGLYRFLIEDSTWIQVYNQGYNPVEVDNLWITDSGNLIAGTHWWGLKYTTNSGMNWKTISAPAGFYAIETINDSIFIGGGSDHIFVSSDTGKTWMVTGNFSGASLYYEPSSQVLYLGTSTNCAIHTSTDFGQNWTLLYHFPPSGLAQSITGIRVTTANQVILANEYIGSPFGVSYRLHQSTDHGQSWQVIYQSSYTPVTSILEDEYFNLYALAGNKLFDSSDEVQTWIIKDVPNSRVLAADHSGRIYLDLRYSTDQGSNWTAMPGSGFEGAFNDAIAINQNNRIYAASTQGIFYAEADSIVVSIEDIEPAKTFFLSQNYPNPFNPVTSIQYAVSSRQFVTLKVYDILGNEITTLVNEEKQPGSYEVEFSASSGIQNLVSGIYFYQLKAGKYIETKKMVLLK